MAARFRMLSRRSKAIVVTQLAIMGLLLGLSARRSYVNHSTNTSPPIEIPYSTFLDFCQGTNKHVHIANVLIGPDRIAYRLFQVDTEEQDQRKAVENQLEGGGAQIPQRMAYTRKVSASDQLLQHLRQYDVPFSAAPVKTNYAALSAKTFILAFYALILLRMYRTMNGGGSGGSPGTLATPTTTVGASFDDIEGIDGAKYEVMELVDTLRNPDKYSILGARAPTGLLLEGPPGTGKTMLARATAATAGVPLLYCSGSDFVEMFVGRGAARVRKTFEKALKLAPCIIFIDELDALGKSRDYGMMGGMGGGRGNDEAEQTLNQLLACMDGLDSSRRVCVMAATNRKDVLDPALVRPGRFDRIIRLELPSTLGRERILRVHAKKLPGFLEGKGIDEQRPARCECV
jgi:ATP-dependent Zn protease